MGKNLAHFQLPYYYIVKFVHKERLLNESSIEKIRHLIYLHQHYQSKHLFPWAIFQQKVPYIVGSIVINRIIET